MSILSRPRWLRHLLSFFSATLLLVGGARLAAQTPAAGQRLLLVHDNAKVTEPLVAFLKEHGGFDTLVVDQAHLPPAAEWSGFRAVLGYVHGKLLEPTELAIIDYTKKGGRFVALHHMVSSGKAENKYYFDFMGLRLEDPKNSPTPKEPGGNYGWYTGGKGEPGKGEPGIEQTLVNLNPNHFITSNKVTWGATAHYQSSDTLDVAREYPRSSCRRARLT